MEPIRVSKDFEVNGVEIVCERSDWHGHIPTRETYDRLGISWGVERLRLHKCVECGGWHVSDWARTTCSEECRRARLRRQSRSYTAKRAERRREGRESKVCAHCGAAVECERDHDKRPAYCSSACKQAAYRKRKREAQQQDPARI